MTTGHQRIGAPKNKENKMDIRIGKYRLTSDRYNYIVSEVKVLGKDSKTPGVETFTDFTYFPTILSALNDVLRRDTRKSSATTLEQLLKELQGNIRWLEGVIIESLSDKDLKETLK